MIEPLYAAFALLGACALLAVLGRWLAMARLLGGLAAAALALTALLNLPGAIPRLEIGFNVVDQPVALAYAPEALWLMLFGSIPAALAFLVGPPQQQSAGWCLGAALTLLGALVTFGAQDGIALLIAWEVMTLGSALMLLSERFGERSAGPVLFMLSLLEVGAIALLVGFVVLANTGAGMDFRGFAQAAAALPAWQQLAIGVLLLIGFGAKLGVLPFYEWYPAAYASGSGATDTLFSGIVLNAAFFALGRGLLDWLGGIGADWMFALGLIVLAAGVVSAILTSLYAFQEQDWRGLLSFSTAENAAIAVAMLGAALLFGASGLRDLAGLAWIVALLHMAAHSLAKSALLLSADAAYAATGSYALRCSGLLRRSAWPLGVGAVLAGMSLAALPPQGGFASEWLVFQTLFQGFHLPSLAARLALALAGAGLALTAAVAFATFVKVCGLGLLGQGAARRIGAGHPMSVLILGAAVLALGAGLPWWLDALAQAGGGSVALADAPRLREGLMLVPLTAKFAFISPSMLAIVMPLLALVPLAMLAWAARRFPIQRTAVWFGGLAEDPQRSATTSLSFANAMRTFYSFIYRPTHDVAHEYGGPVYFVKRLTFNHEVAPIFGPCLFSPLTRMVDGLAGRLRLLQSGNLNFYLALVGAVLVVILGISLLE